MATTRLTKCIREALLKKLLQRAFQSRAQSFVDECAAFVDRVYRDAFQDKLERMDALPDGWLDTDYYITVQIAGEVRRMKFDGSLDGWNLPEQMRQAGARGMATHNRRFTARTKSQVVKIYEPTHELSKELTDLLSRREDLCEEIRKAVRSAKAAMESVSTVKKLIDVWPEVEEFAKHYLEDGDRKAILPAIPRDQLNTMLNLPPEEKSIDND